MGDKIKRNNLDLAKFAEENGLVVEYDGSPVGTTEKLRDIPMNFDAIWEEAARCEKAGTAFKYQPPDEIPT
ncbi:MAG: hypothetical protein PHW53_04450 [Patescibacteria group bacterium]|nr:hypothetical protein [Patescibacteria group bacterium]